MSSGLRKLQRNMSSGSRTTGVHLPHMARLDDPVVVHCTHCDRVTVVRADEDPHCANCGTPLCDDCKGKLREDGRGRA